MNDSQLSAVPRLHAFDGLRAAMLLLGLVLHSACNYQDSPADATWNFRDPQGSSLFGLMILYIHVWRMPIFMFIAGFFSALLVERRGDRSFISNRLSRLGLPMLIFLPLMVPLTISAFVFANGSRYGGSADAGFGVVSSMEVSNLFVPITIHLWFLYYLLFYCVGAFLLIRAGRLCLPEGVRSIPTRMLGFLTMIPGGTLLLCLPLILFLKNTAGLLATGFTFIPERTSFFAYGFIYLCGWAFWSQRTHLDRLKSWPKSIGSILLTLILYPYWLEFFLQWLGLPAGDLTRSTCATLGVEIPDRETILWIGASLSALMMWNGIWGFLGLCLLVTDREIPRIRYIVDGSYWVYIIHLPFTVLIPGLLVHQSLGAFPKFFITLGLTTLIGYLTYDWFVRGGVIGKILNGRRWPRALGKAIRNQDLAPLDTPTP
ncbi:MAG: acyltransferase family protein [Planctomycetota bacterium]|nr:acyltransferase family protein [Planctomycetota bacterium]